MPVLCLTLAEASLAELERKLEWYAARVHLIEVRLDHLDRPAIPRLPDPCSAQLVATARPEREGGRWQGSESKRLALLRGAAEAGFAWVDLEHDAIAEPMPAACRIIRSLHDFSGTPDLKRAMGRLAVHGADCYKLAVQTQSTRDLVALLRWRESLGPHCNVLALGMGEMGRLSRLLGPFLGNPWTYVAEDGGQPVAPGQFSLGEAIDRYRLDQWVRIPEIYGVIGNPVGHSRSPQLHNTLFRHYGLEKLYLPVPVDDLEAWFGYLEDTALPFRGFSVTIPHKLGVGKFCSVRESGSDSLNTLTWNGTGWTAATTDIEGFVRPLQFRYPDLAGRSAVVLGTGGVAEAVIPALRDLGMEVIVVGRNPERTAGLAKRFGCRHGSLAEPVGTAFLCVNTTPVGQFPHVDEAPLDPGQIHFDVVYDLVYNPSNTRLLQMARERGAEVISGRDMFVEQAVGQFIRWTGIDPDRELMRKALEEGA